MEAVLVIQLGHHESVWKTKESTPDNNAFVWEPQEKGVNMLNVFTDDSKDTSLNGSISRTA